VNLRRYVATSDKLPARVGRKLYRWIANFSVPAPRAILWPALQVFLFARSVYYFVARVFICEPFFKAYCTRLGRNFHTGVWMHWVLGEGEIIIGDDVTIDGKCSFMFSPRYCKSPTLTIGSRTFIGHDSRFTVGKSITIGADCKLATSVFLLDMSGHPTDPAERLANLPTPSDRVRPITIEDNVWIGTGATICPGVTVGKGSVIGAYAVVTRDVRPNTLVAGNPAREVRELIKTAAGREENDRSDAVMSESRSETSNEALL
jgi:acetyltransferase-like isoleucine patch superfamily enzyme